MRGEGGPQSLILVGILVFLLIRSTSKISETLDNPLWDKKKKDRKKKLGLSWAVPSKVQVLASYANNLGTKLARK